MNQPWKNPEWMRGYLAYWNDEHDCIWDVPESVFRSEASESRINHWLHAGWHTAWFECNCGYVEWTVDNGIRRNFARTAAEHAERLNKMAVSPK